MTKPVLQTRILGMQPDSRDLMRPPEIVYECKEPPAPHRARPSWALKIWTLACVGVCAYVFFGALYQVAF